MQAIARELSSTNWITLVLFFAIGLVFLLKLFNPTKLTGYATSFYRHGFIKKHAEEAGNPFGIFNSLLFFFSTTVVALLITIFTAKEQARFSVFLQILACVVLYLFFRFLLDALLSKLLQIQQETRYFLFCKADYLYTCCLWILPVLILTVYSLQNTFLLSTLCVLLFTLRLALILTNNKNLIFKKLFYFILYICALELTPLVAFFKLTS